MISTDKSEDKVVNKLQNAKHDTTTISDKIDSTYGYIYPWTGFRNSDEYTALVFLKVFRQTFGK